MERERNYAVWEWWNTADDVTGMATGLNRLRAARGGFTNGAIPLRSIVTPRAPYEKRACCGVTGVQALPYPVCAAPPYRIPLISGLNFQMSSWQYRFRAPSRNC